MTVLEYAAHASALHGRQLSRQAITAAIKRGAIATDRAGRIIVSRADAEWAPSARGRPRKEPVVEQPAAEPSAATPTTTAPGLPTAAASSQVIQSIKAEREMAAWKREQGLTVDREKVVNLLVDFAAHLSAEMLSYPRRMQAELVRTLRCRQCGGDVDGKHIAIAAEKFVDGFLRMLAANPLGEAKGA